METNTSFTLVSTRAADECSMIVTREPTGLITIQDYSHANDREKLVALLEKMGLTMKLVSETLMDFHTVPGHKQRIFEKLSEGSLSGPKGKEG